MAGRYEIEGLVGEGGMSLVFRARDLRHRRQVAIKVLEPSVSIAIGTDRFMREIEIAARLSHPHILPLLDSGSMIVEGRCTCPFYVMPFVEGETLRDRLARGPLPSDEATRIAVEVASALDYAHRHGVVHRDIKPENVMFQDGLAVVADFGVARALDEASEHQTTLSGVLIGTPQYMSPEQVAGDPVDHRADVYSLGCVLYEMLTGTPPFADTSVQAVLARRLSEPPPRVKEYRADVPAQIDSAVRRAMATNPGDRFGSAAELVGALRTAGVDVERPRRSAIRVAVLALPAIAIGIAAIVTLARSDPSPIATLAIRSLVNTSQDTTTLYLSEGLEEAVADRLRLLPQLTVAAPTLVNQILAEAPGLDLQALGRRLRVGAVLTWTLRRSGDSVRLRAELIGSEDGRIIWGETFARSASDVASMPGDIAQQVSSALRLELDPPEAGVLARRPTHDGAAYDAYLRGRRAWLRATPLGPTDARWAADTVRRYARMAIARDPNFAGGHYLLGAYYTISAIRGWREPFGAVLDSGMAANRRALELDSTMADAQLVDGIAHFFITDRLDLARDKFRRAVQLNPDLSNARLYYGIYLGEVERKLDSAIYHARRAVDLEPQPHYLNTLGDLYIRAAKFDSAVIVLRQAIADAPGVVGPHHRLVRAYEELGRYRDAVAARGHGPDSASAEAFATALGRDGQDGYRRELRRDLERQIEELLAMPVDPARPDSVPPIREHRIANLYARLGEWTKAMDWVLREYERRPGRLAFVLGDPDFDGIRRDPRFAPLVRRAGLEPHSAGAR